MKRVVILGGGSGGAVAASRLGKWARPGEFEVVLIDRSEWHEFRPSYLWVAVGKREPEEIRRPLAALERRYGTRVMRATVTGIRPETQTVETDQGNVEYDYLIVALGAELVQTPDVAGCEAPWELAPALALRERLRTFAGGRVVVGPLSWPYRCPPAPFEVAFMLKYLAEQRGVVERTHITVFHPWKDPMETFGPQMVEGFRRFLNDFGVHFERGFVYVRDDPGRRVIVAADGRELAYNFCHRGATSSEPRGDGDKELAIDNSGRLHGRSASLDAFTSVRDGVGNRRCGSPHDQARYGRCLCTLPSRACDRPDH
ncbi:NAD(P)/FAD-dependent oxidoreductase [Thermomicrobium sp. CFH 73360]|uniref:NAD(P)/FAD-dependent oxidoreductase n=1 Tax=Thermomicrobium sp. CFH 73360 TaxID=2951987 RepID=UPI0020774DDA|nr:FAD/NAD(P)-binding oxidoreductase [Thermomicrobium sp. CFH 73360]MCM8746832.1 NAD(P)/FAD-dependent oxidoreductase [Thermomicrobium sp. CFH 73360]